MNDGTHRYDVIGGPLCGAEATVDSRPCECCGRERLVVSVPLHQCHDVDLDQVMSRYEFDDVLRRMTWSQPA